MRRLPANRFEREFYADEVEQRRDGRNTTYFIVSNPDRFANQFQMLFAMRRRTMRSYTSRDGNYRRPRKAEKTVMQALEGGFRSKYVQPKFENIGYTTQQGSIDLAMIPISECRLTQGTPYHGHSDIMLFRCQNETVDGRRSDELEYTLTQHDLDQICMMSSSKRGGLPGLTKVPNLFTMMREGTALTFAERCQAIREVNTSLQSLRNAGDAIIRAWTCMKLEMEGAEYDPPKDMWYLDYAREVNAITSSDRIQGMAFFYAGNAAVHDDKYSYNQIHGRMFLHWLTDLVDRTLGHFRIDHRRMNGDIFGNEIEIDPESFFAVRGLSDQLQAMKRKELANPSRREIYHEVIEEEDGKRVKRVIEIDKDILMEAAFATVSAVRRAVEVKGGTFHQGDHWVFKIFDHWAKGGQLRPERYTPEDAERAAAFAINLFYHSKEIDHERLAPVLPGDARDSNRNVVVLRKGMGRTRYEQYGWGKDLEFSLRERILQLRTVTAKLFPDVDGEWIRNPEILLILKAMDDMRQPQPGKTAPGQLTFDFIPPRRITSLLEGSGAQPDLEDAVK